MDRESKIKLVNNVRYWRHRIDLGDNVITHGSTVINTFDRFGLGEREIKGKSFLDIGAWDGYYSFKAEQNGASKILATDVWQDIPHNKKRWDTIREGNEGILAAKKALESKINIQNLDVYNVANSNIGNFDIVNFTGVIYHLKNPVLALEAISKVCNKFMIFDTTAFKLLEDGNEKFEDEPLLKLRPGNAGWFFNKTCIHKMINNAGFKKIVYPNLKGKRTNNDTRKGILRAGTKIKMSLDSDEFYEADLGNSEVIVLGTDQCNMDINNPDATWVKIQDHQVGAVQGWIPKGNVTFVNTPINFPGTTNRVELYRLHLIAYK